MPPNTTASTGQQPGKSGRKKGRKARLVVFVLVLALIGGVVYGAGGPPARPQTKGSITLEGLSGPSTSSVTATESRRSTPPPTRTCSWRRATSRRRTGSTRWTSAGT
ncbi:hypothetical protein SHIRM173S_01229 [Streptomyces hirsutus]